MRKVLVRYRVKEGRGDENAAFVAKVFAELEASSPPGLRYISLQGDDGLSFFHLAFVEGDENPLPKTAAFKAFQAELKGRCDVPPEAVDVTVVGSYGF